MPPRSRKAQNASAQHLLCAPAVVRNLEQTGTAQTEDACLLGPCGVGIDQTRDDSALGPYTVGIDQTRDDSALGPYTAGIDQAREDSALGPYTARIDQARENSLLGPCVAGIDEAGRGCLAGPVVAAAVILAPNFALPGLNDSKQLSAKQREILAPRIKSCALAWSVGLSWPREIEHYNILQATFHAMSRAVRSLRLPPQHLLIDGNKTIPQPVLQRYCRAFLPSQQAIIGGDALEAAISAASILAKTYRDHLMCLLHTRHPVYGFDHHKGYGTKEHLQRLREHGPCPQHRRTFAGVLPADATQQFKKHGGTPMQGKLC